MTIKTRRPSRHSLALTGDLWYHTGRNIIFFLSLDHDSGKYRGRNTGGSSWQTSHKSV